MDDTDRTIILNRLDRLDQGFQIKLNHQQDMIRGQLDVLDAHNARVQVLVERMYEDVILRFDRLEALLKDKGDPK